MYGTKETGRLYSPWVTKVGHNLVTKPPPPLCTGRCKSLGLNMDLSYLEPMSQHLSFPDLVSQHLSYLESVSQLLSYMEPMY